MLCLQFCPTKRMGNINMGCIFMLHVLCHGEAEKSLWNVIVIFLNRDKDIMGNNIAICSK